jgi:sulfur-carrier protein
MQMTIKVRFFAALREQVGATRVDVEMVSSGTFPVREVWLRATGLEPDEHNLVAINQCYAGWDARVAGGDEVAFFPPVTGG